MFIYCILALAITSANSQINERPQVFFDIEIDGLEVGRIVFSLFSDVVPKTAENFRALATGEHGQPLEYLNSIFYSIIPDFGAFGGDIINGDGSGGESIYGPTFNDENLELNHSEVGLLTMVR